MSSAKCLKPSAWLQLLTQELVLVLVLVLVLTLPSHSDAACNPASSAPNTSVTVATDSGSGSTCYFPFTESSTTYSDCTQYCSGSVCRYWCATSCDYGSNSGLWRYCNFQLANLSLPNCSSLAAAAPSAEPSVLYAGSGSGTQCVFPFLYNGQCYNDCITTTYYPWCATTAESALIDYNYKYCAYTIAGAASQSCASLGDTAPAYITPQLSSYSVAYNQSDPYANCTFPFYYNGRCYDDCTSGANFPWYLIWCSTEKYYEPNRRIRFCPYYRKYASVTSLSLRWGFYRIYLQLGCGSGGALCNATVAPANYTAPLAALGARRLGLRTQSTTLGQMWEAMPQPNGFFIFRTVVPCYTPADAWSTDSTDATYENITQEREFWTVTSAGGTGRGGLYTIQSAYDSTAGYYLGPATVSGYSVLTLQSGTSYTWLFEEITNLEKSQLSVCDQLDIDGSWCAWSNYTREAGDWLVRSRNCSCPAQAGNGTACAGNATERELVVNGTWCSWSDYQPLAGSGGAYASRTRACNCSAPAFGGDNCPGSGNDTGLVVSGVWCAWSNFTLTGASGTRVRTCACPEPAYGGSNCSGAWVDTGPTVNGSWCDWGAFSVVGPVGTRTRLCNCSGPAYGGTDCPGTGVDSGTVSNGTWCDWGPFQASSDGVTATRLRLCNCTAPAYGGVNCQGSGNDTGPMVNGTWCAWGGYQVSSGYGTRTRLCNCSMAAYGGADCPGNSTETQAVVNGTWCPWGPYLVSGSNSSRTRACNCSAPAYGGTACPGVDAETQVVVNGSWCAWGAFSVSGLQGSRSRVCACPAADFGGVDCPGSGNDTGLAVNGSWCAWGPYQVSGSYATRLRNCSCPQPSYGGANCAAGAGNDTGPVVPGAWCPWGNFTQSGVYGSRQRDCNCSAPDYGGADCPGSGNDTGLTAHVAWCAWSAYSVSGGVGTRLRNCSCPQAPAYGGSAACPGGSNETGTAVDAAWCAWSAYADDGAGNETRWRNCSCPTAAYGGADCPGSGVESRRIANGSWCAWGDYAVDGGWGQRNRTCNCPAASALGAPCQGNATDSLAQVNGTWCAWSALEFGYGETLRTRACNCSAPNAIGANCTGAASETYPCNSTACATTAATSVDGAWCTWSAYAAGPGNSGYMVRNRSCDCPAASGSGGVDCAGSRLENVTCTLTACRKYMAVPAESGSSGAGASQVATGAAKLVGLLSAVCAAAVAALVVGAGLTLWKVAAAAGSAATAPA